MKIDQRPLGPVLGERLDRGSLVGASVENLEFGTAFEGVVGRDDPADAGGSAPQVDAFTVAPHEFVEDFPEPQGRIVHRRSSTGLACGLNCMDEFPFSDIKLIHFPIIENLARIVGNC
ncbi:hypothetical protein ACIBG7_35915 [Nonomuraea sp. NPDC050328]|uniref:hypothetical protein n=1 Tax=Nonomuraea sp. NPDC050328 TaxID=3364361 RepID=UPI00378CA97B